MSQRPDASRFFFLTAFFPARVFVFGDWHEEYSLPGRWVLQSACAEIAEFARKVAEAGGLFYLDGLKFRFYVNPAIGPAIIRDGWSEWQDVRRVGLALASCDAPGACEDAAQEARGLYVPVTRKVSLTDETRGTVGR